MPGTATSPRILTARWGRLTIEGLPIPFKDAKLYPGGAQSWNWTETGTRHRPGVQPADVEEILSHGATILVLSRGMLGWLDTAPETLALLHRRGIPVVSLRTPEAVKLYNQLAHSMPVGALIHSTC